MTRLSQTLIKRQLEQLNMTIFKLDSKPKINSGFKVPDDYFDNFSENLVQKLVKKPIAKETKVLSMLRNRKNIFMAVAAVLVLALMIPVVYQLNTNNTNLDAITMEDYLAEETHLDTDELTKEFELNNSTVPSNTKGLSTETLEDILVVNPNIENLVIEN